MCRVSSVTAAITCLLALLLAAAAAAAAADHYNYCTLLAHKSDERAKENPGWRKEPRSVAYRGVAVNVSLVWGSEPARAAAALLAALLRHVRLYRGVHLPRTASPHDTAALAASVTYNERANYKDLVVGISTAWQPVPPQSETMLWGSESGLAGPRLVEFGASPVAARRRLFAWLTENARLRRPCVKQHVRWPFYTNQTALAGCDFVNAANPQDNEVTVYVLGEDDCEDVVLRLQRRAEHSGARLRVQRRGRAGFERSLQASHSANRSFLFLDYDMWQGAPKMSIVEPPPCVSVDFHCKQELDSAIAMRVADVNILQSYAPQFYQFIYAFKPSPQYLRFILERQASGVDIEEAACETALAANNYGYKTDYDLHLYTLVAFFCYDDPSNQFYFDITEAVGAFIYEQTKKFGCDIQIAKYFVNCSDDHHMSEKLNHIIGTAGFTTLVGVVSMTVAGSPAASAVAAANRVPLVLTGVVPEDDSARSTWRVGPRPRHLAQALLHFVREARWTRVAVLYQDTQLAQDYYAALKEGADIVFGDFPIPSHNITIQQVQKVLQDLQDVNARIVFVNADARAASTILAAAAAARMGYTDGFVWIVRDWQQNGDVCRTEYFTISSWTREKGDLPPGEGNAYLRKKLNELAATDNDPWPPGTVSLVNALLTLSIGFRDLFIRFPSMRQNLHNNQMIRSLKESLISKPVTGFSHELRFKERFIDETFVFVDQWCGGNFTQRLATWRVNATSGAVRNTSAMHATLSPPEDLPRDDGASGCTVRSGDVFHPTCHDVECACALMLLALAPVAALLARRALRRRLARLQQELLIQMIARRRHVATVLAAYLVKRAALELHEELGAGRFGSVRLARLREPARTPRYIAAKALRENAAPAEESEFLREACIIASLDHVHIVRLVGVCIADGPPLVLMELAFFGDLLGYLRARRHLVEGAGLEGLEEPEARGEAEHVSATALTRLAREAAEALQYLGVRGVVHRDVRAANCLVDVRRSLKLADFGMARDTVASADGAAEYACRRRGLFPVLWMAPESLAHGVFSAASDVWALAVLVLELVTLGARPYGAMSPLRVLEYVAAGGSPPLPLDATPQTRGLTRLCWARAAERRPSAAEVAAYLAAWPLALRPALLCERDEPADADSGFGESPSTELLPPDSPLHSLDQLDDLAATH